MKVYALEVDLKKAEKQVSGIIKDLQEKTEKECLFISRLIMQETIETSGFSTWQKNKFEPEKPPLAFLKFFVKLEGNKVGFLPGKKVNNFFLNRYVENHQAGFQVKTTNRMQRFFASKGFFIRKSTKFLKIPARPIIPIAQKRIIERLESIYPKRFEKVTAIGNENNFRKNSRNF